MSTERTHVRQCSGTVKSSSLNSSNNEIDAHTEEMKKRLTSSHKRSNTPLKLVAQLVKYENEECVARCSHFSLRSQDNTSDIFVF